MLFRPLPWLTVFSIAALAVLFVLGQWQYAKFSEKRALEAAGPPPLPPIVTLTDRQAPPVFVRTTLSDVLDPPRSLLGWKVVFASEADGRPVFRVAQIVEGNTPPPADAFEPSQRPLDVRGVPTEPSGRNWFTPPPDHDRRAVYDFDSELMADLAGLGATDAPLPLFEPHRISVLTEAGTERGLNPFARPDRGDTLPPERHFGYALTWWGLALALIGVYLAFHLTQGRLRLRG